MQRIFFSFLVIFLLGFSLNSNAQETSVKISQIVEFYKEKPYYIHFVQKGETIEKIAEAYKVSIQQLRVENDLSSKTINPNTILRIPQTKDNSSIVVKEEPKAKPNEVKLTTEIKPADNEKSVIYIVEKRDSLYGIARKFNISVDALIKANPDVKDLKKGMRLVIPSKEEKVEVPKPEYKVETKPHVSIGTISVPNIESLENDTTNEIIVQPKQTLYSIANQFNTTIDSLIILNPSLRDGLKAGMTLKVRPDKTKINKTISFITNENFNENCPESPYSKEYNVGLLLPFESSSDSENNKDFLHVPFYGGFMIAADSLSKLGAKLNIYVYNAENETDTRKINNLLKQDKLKEMDMIVGPLYLNSFKFAEDFAFKNQIPIVNPLSKRDNIIDGNPYVVKFQPSAEAISMNLFKFVKKIDKPTKVIVIDNEEATFEGCVDQIKEMQATMNSSLGNSAEVVTLTYKGSGVRSVVSNMSSDKENVIVFLSVNPLVVKEFVSLLNSRRGSYAINLIGFDGWEYVDVETENLQRLNYIQFSFANIDYENQDVRNFVEKFKTQYNSMPSDKNNAFLGFDIGMQSLSALVKYDKNFINCFGNSTTKGLSGNFIFYRKNINDGLQNYGIKTLKLVDYLMEEIEL